MEQFKWPSTRDAAYDASDVYPAPAVRPTGRAGYGASEAGSVRRSVRGGDMEDGNVYEGGPQYRFGEMEEIGQHGAVLPLPLPLPGSIVGPGIDYRYPGPSHDYLSENQNQGYPARSPSDGSSSYGSRSGDHHTLVAASSYKYQQAQYLAGAFKKEEEEGEEDEEDAMRRSGTVRDAAAYGGMMAAGRLRVVNT